jgi:2-polyprenyl-3-methyl-5-hydroxy-6-metoxy-1,4-benzoquinol methylase
VEIEETPRLPYDSPSHPVPDAGERDLEATLRARRAAAAADSRGTSDDAIYTAIERALASIDTPGDVLDFGSGTGQLTLRLRHAGRYRSVTGADLFPRAGMLPADVRWVQSDLNDPLPVEDRSFDVVVAAEVIEHLENPRAMCREIFRLLRPGGWIVLSTPNNESWRSLAALVVRGHFVAFGESSYPAHITPLVRQDLDHVLTEAGFVDRSFSFSEVGGIPGLPARRWQSLLGGWAKGLRFSDNVVVTARKPGAAAR